MKCPARLIDSHQHVWWHGRDDQGLVADMDEHGIEYAWLLSWEIPPFEDHPAYHGVLDPRHMRADGTHAGIPLAAVLEARERHPKRFVAGYCPHPAVGDAPALLEAAAKMHEVRVCGEWKFRVPFDDPRCIELFRKAGELRLPVVLHLDVPWRKKEGKPIYDPLWYGGTTANLERALQACPETKFIGHAPGFWREISDDADERTENYPKGPVTGPGRIYGLFDRYPNLYADLSAGSARYALERDPAHAVKFLARYADRLLFGRDYYGRELGRFLESVELPLDAAEKICYKNAERLVSGPGPFGQSWKPEKDKNATPP
ncbi:MAG: amidohydrolase family protein [Verrucomicrobiae bacterium]|nr:amidohydrolase family protein [Verrucomicrobiae bacterium]